MNTKSKGLIKRLKEVKEINLKRYKELLDKKYKSTEEWQEYYCLRDMYGRKSDLNLRKRKKKP